MVSPLGGVPAVEVTVAVKVTACPTNNGLSEEISVVVVGLWLDTLLFSSTPTEERVQISVSSAQMFATRRSGLPSPFKSAVATELVKKPPESYVCGVWKVPSPLPKSKTTKPLLRQLLPPQESVATASSLPSPFTSATDSEVPQPSAPCRSVTTG